MFVIEINFKQVISPLKSFRGSKIENSFYNCINFLLAVQYFGTGCYHQCCLVFFLIKMKAILIGNKSYCLFSRYWEI